MPLQGLDSRRLGEGTSALVGSLISDLGSIVLMDAAVLDGLAASLAPGGIQ